MRADTHACRRTRGLQIDDCAARSYVRPGLWMNDQQENDGGTWDRIVRGLPVFCTGDGLGLWQSTHRDDAAKFFAGAAMAPQTYGQAFNVMRDELPHGAATIARSRARSTAAPG